MAQLVERLEGLVNRLEACTSTPSSTQEDELRQALQDAVATLHATKSSFHSKQLKQLRERLEAVLNR